MTKLFNFPSLLFFISLTYSQQWLKIDSVFSPFGVSSQSFSAPVFCDLDDDGDFDLINGSLGANRIEYFKNLGTSTTPRYKSDTSMFSSIYANGYQFTNADYPAATDLDGDGDYDLVISGYNALLLYWNVGDSTQPLWQKDTVIFTSVNSMIGTDAKPAFADLDGDGDPDLITGIGESLFGGPTAGTSMGFRNNGTPGSPNFISDNALVIGITDVGLNAYPTFNDWDNDGDLDMVMGRDLQTMLYYKNTGTKNTPAWTSTGGIVSVLETSTYWKNPSLCDLDGDGDFDLIYGTADGAIFYYQNIGTKTTPQLQYNPSYFQIIRIDGGASTVSLADYDKDGDMDLLSGDWLGKFQYFRNDGNAQYPNFKKTTAPFTSLDAGSYSSPKFFDPDKDGDLDIVSGELNGTIVYYINNNGSFVQNTTLFAGIDVGYRSAPAFVDINDDGYFDLFVGAEESAKYQFYGNTGNNTFVADNTLFTGVTASRNAHPFFVDLDKDNDFDLVLGTSSGTLYYYENTGDKSYPAWKRNDAVFTGVKVPQDATPAFADFDDDGKSDLIVGEYNGNFSFYKNLMVTSVKQIASSMPNGFGLKQNFPNPFNPVTTITFSIPFAETHNYVSLQIFDLLGREIATLVNEPMNPGTYTETWDAGNVPSGVYLYRLQSGNYSETKRMILLK